VLAADAPIEVLEQRAERAIEPGQQVLHLVAARTEGVSHRVE
jgi:hypothetical protein